MLIWLLLWMALIVLLIVVPVRWGYRRWGAPYPAFWGSRELGQDYQRATGWGWWMGLLPFAWIALLLGGVLWLFTV